TVAAQPIGTEQDPPSASGLLLPVPAQPTRRRAAAAHSPPAKSARRRGSSRTPGHATSLSWHDRAQAEIRISTGRSREKARSEAARFGVVPKQSVGDRVSLPNRRRIRARDSNGPPPAR